MNDSDTQGSVSRIEPRNQWMVGWVSCGVTSLLSVGLIVADWERRALVGKTAALAFILFLVVFPVTVLVRLRTGKPVTAGWVFSLGYILLLLALYAFGPLAHSH